MNFNILKGLTITSIDGLEEGVYAEDFSSYEEALNGALQEMCNLI